MVRRRCAVVGSYNSRFQDQSSGLAERRRYGIGERRKRGVVLLRSFGSIRLDFRESYR